MSPRRARLAALFVLAAGLIAFLVWLGLGEEREPARDRPAAGPTGARSVSLSPEEEEKELLRAWRPMAGTRAESHSAIRVLLKHRMTKERILRHLDRSVYVDKRNSRQGSWYIPVAPSQGFSLIFDASGHLVRVLENGEVVTPPAEMAADPNWPIANPVRPPTDRRFADLAPEEMIDFIAGGGSLPGVSISGPDDLSVACAWFIWKTRRTNEGPRLRRELVEKIYGYLQEVKQDPRYMLHDQSHRAALLGPLGARAELRRLLAEVEYFGCCYGPALVGALAECGDLRDAFFLLEQAGKESESSDDLINQALERLTGTKVSPPGAGRTDVPAWRERLRAIAPPVSPAAPPGD